MLKPENTCLSCFAHLDEPKGVCPHCGFDNASCQNAVHQLECGSILAGAYLVGRVLGQGGFGITYTGWDLNLETRVAIKEYYPEGCVTRDAHTHVSVLSFAGEKEALFQKGRERFVDEAKILAKFSGESSIVGVRSFFFENGTAYIVMDYVEGETLKAYAARRGGRIPAAELLPLMRPLMRSLARVHGTGLLHRDISPDNIMLRRDGTLTLLDFGAARQMSMGGEHSNTINVKHGFAPEEQYRTRGEQGPWTDVYALAATIYRLVTGQMPPQALDRLTFSARLSAPNHLGANLSAAEEQALVHALAIRAQDRTPDMTQFEKELYESPAEKVSPAESQRVTPPAAGASPRSTPVPPAHSPAAGQKTDRQKRGLTIGLIAGAVVLAAAVIGAIASTANKSKAETTIQQQANVNGIPVEVTAGLGVAVNAGLSTDSTNDIAQPTATSLPAVNPDPVSIFLDYGESYQCATTDFDLPYEIPDSDVIWTNEDDDSGITCSASGRLQAGNIQFDPGSEYNEATVISGTTENGSLLEYKIYVGDGHSYSFSWSDSARNMKSVYGYTLIATPQIQSCEGFTLYFGYDLTKGKITGTSWSVWVREGGTTWVNVTNIDANAGNYKYYEVDFDRPISFTEIIVQPPTTYDYFEYNTNYGIFNIAYAVD